MTELKGRLLGTTSKTPVYSDPLKADFRNFLFAIWQHLGLPNPTPVQYDIAQWLQNGPKRSVTMAFRGVGKSWVTAAFVLWLLYRDPDHKVLVVSANQTKADEFSTFALRLIMTVPFLAHLQPGKDSRQSMLMFDVGPAKPDIAPSVKSVGINGQMTGSRADTIVADDIEIPRNSDTMAKRELLLNSIKEFDAVLKPGGRVIYLGTPQTEQSIYNELEARGYTIRIWPARIPKADNRYGHRLAPLIRKLMLAEAVGKTTDPQRFSDEDLAGRELSYGRSGFMLQFMIDTSLSDQEKHPLKLAELIVHPLDPFRGPTDLVWAASPDCVISNLPMVGLHGDRFYRPAWTSGEYAPYEGCIMFVDPSGRGKDETAYAIVKLLHGRLFLTAAGGFLGGYDDETLKAILMVAKKQNVPKIIVEPNFGGGMFTKLLQSAAQKWYTVSVEDAEWVSTSKEMRIVDTLEPVLNQHRLIVCPSVIQSDYDSTEGRNIDDPNKYRLFFQMARMVRAKGALAQDDRIDALAGAVAYWVEQLSRDTEQASVDHEEAKFDALLEKYMNGVLSKGTDTVGHRKLSSSIGKVSQKKH